MPEQSAGLDSERLRRWLGGHRAVGSRTPPMIPPHAEARAGSLAARANQTVARTGMSTTLHLLSLGLLLPSAIAAEPTVISVRVVKDQAGRAASPPVLTFETGQGAWQIIDRPTFRGENDWEAYWELESARPDPPLPKVTVTLPGIGAQRVLVGKTDVPFTQDGDRVTFELVKDLSRGLGIEVVYRSPRGGLPIYLRHNWPMRRAGEYARDPYPDGAVRAIKNHLLAAQEALRRMVEAGDIGGFDGEIVLMDSEINATRGHLDYPPHVHIMHYQFAVDAAGKRDFVSRLVPHIYLDEAGRTVSNRFDAIVGSLPSATFGPGQVCAMTDVAERPVLSIMLDDGDLVLRGPTGSAWRIRPDPEQGGAEAVTAWHGGQPAFRVEAVDEYEAGIFRYTVTSFQEGHTDETFRHGYRYDPFTGKVLEQFAPETTPAE